MDRSVSRLYAGSGSLPPQQPHSISVPDDTVLDEYLQTAQLRKAIQYMETHPDTSISRERWSRIFTAIEERTATADLIEPPPLSTATTGGGGSNFPLESVSRQEMTEMYQLLTRQNHLRLFGAATRTPPAAGTHALPPDVLERILDLPMKALTPKPTNTLLIAGAAVAILEGIASVVTGISLNALVLLTLALATLDRILANGAVLESFLKLFNPGVQDKILRHEAGHFLAAYLLGCPVEGIVLSAWAALRDKRFGSRQVSAGTSFYDPELSRQINQPSRQVSRDSIDRYSIIVMAGIAAEADCYGRADGGAGDEMALIAFLSQLNGLGRKAVPWNGETIRNQARWGALQAVLLLRHYKPAYEALVDALERGGSLGDCIYAIEKAARDHNLQPLNNPLGLLVSDGTKVTWNPTVPQTGGVPATTESAMIENDAKSAMGAQHPLPVVDSNKISEAESLATLQQYRTVIERRLQDLERQLDEIK